MYWDPTYAKFKFKHIQIIASDFYVRSLLHGLISSQSLNVRQTVSPTILILYFFLLLATFRQTIIVIVIVFISSTIANSYEISYFASQSLA